MRHGNNATTTTTTPVILRRRCTASAAQQRRVGPLRLLVFLCLVASCLLQTTIAHAGGGGGPTAAMQIWLDARKKQETNKNKLSSSESRSSFSSMRNHRPNKAAPSSSPLAYRAASDFVVERVQRDSSRRKWIVMNDKTDQMHALIVDASTEQGQEQAMAAMGSIPWILLDNDCHWDDDEDSSTKKTPASRRANPYLPDDRNDNNNNNNVLHDNNDNHNSQLAAATTQQLVSLAAETGTCVAFRLTQMAGLTRALALGVHALCLPVDCNQSLFDAALAAAMEARGEHVSKRRYHRYKQDPWAITVSAHPVQEEEEEETNDENDHDAQIVEGTALRIKDTVVLADRICLDFVQLLKPTEGCWIGSSSSSECMALVLRQAASRPFRLLAGPVHSQIYMADGTTTKYLCELQPGDDVLVVDAVTQTTRAVALGRVQHEVRPCLQVALEAVVHHDDDDNDDSYDNDETPKVLSARLFLPHTETVQLAGPDRRVVRATDLSTRQPTPVLLRWIRSAKETGT